MFSVTSVLTETPGLPARPWLRRLRLSLAGTVLVGGWLLLATGWPRVCHDDSAAGSPAVRVCEAPGIDSPLVLGDVLITLFLLTPELSEFGVPGLLTLKLRVQEQEVRGNITSVAVEGLRDQVLALSSISAATAAVQTNVVINTAAQSGQDVAALTTDYPLEDATGFHESDAGQRVVSARLLLGEKSLQYLFADAASRLGEVSMHLYMPNDEGVLLPVDEPHRDADEAGWQPGLGVVGGAWSSDSVVARRGEQLRSDVAALPRSRQERYADIAVVAALPVRNATDRPIAVLSAASRAAGVLLDSEPATAQLALTASLCARVLIDVLGWEDDWPPQSAMRTVGGQEQC